MDEPYSCPGLRRQTNYSKMSIRRYNAYFETTVLNSVSQLECISAFVIFLVACASGYLDAMAAPLVSPRSQADQACRQLPGPRAYLSCICCVDCYRYATHPVSDFSSYSGSSTS